MWRLKWLTSYRNQKLGTAGHFCTSWLSDCIRVSDCIRLFGAACRLRSQPRYEGLLSVRPPVDSLQWLQRWNRLSRTQGTEITLCRLQEPLDSYMHLHANSWWLTYVDLIRSLVVFVWVSFEVTLQLRSPWKHSWRRRSRSMWCGTRPTLRFLLDSWSMLILSDRFCRVEIPLVQLRAALAAKNAGRVLPACWCSPVAGNLAPATGPATSVSQSSKSRNPKPKRPALICRSTLSSGLHLVGLS